MRAQQYGSVCPLYAFTHDDHFWFLFNRPIFPRDYSRLGPFPNRPPGYLGIAKAGNFYRPDALPVRSGVDLSYIRGVRVSQVNFNSLQWRLSPLRAAILFMVLWFFSVPVPDSL